MKFDEGAGPYRIADVNTVWTRIARMVDHLHGLKVCRLSAARLRAAIDQLEARDKVDVDHPDLELALHALAAPDAMRAADWLRMKVVDLRGRKNVSLHQLDLRDARFRRLVVQVDGEESCRAIVTNLRGDIASVESPNIAHAVDGALRMAGARKEA